MLARAPAIVNSAGARARGARWPGDRGAGPSGSRGSTVTPRAGTTMKPPTTPRRQSCGRDALWPFERQPMQSTSRRWAGSTLHSRMNVLEVNSPLAT